MGAEDFSDSPVRALTDEESWEFVRTQEFGRLAFHLGDEVHIIPINVAVADDGGEPSLMFRTAEGSKLLAVVMNPDVAFEVDDIGPEHALSVVIRGRARRLPENEIHRAENIALRSWVPTLKYDVIEVHVTDITGRHFDLKRPWLRLTP